MASEKFGIGILGKVHIDDDDYPSMYDKGVVGEVTVGASGTKIAVSAIAGVPFETPAGSYNWPDPRVLSIEAGATDRRALVSNYDASGYGDVGSALMGVYDPATNAASGDAWGQPLKILYSHTSPAPTPPSGVTAINANFTNVYGIVKHDGFIYVIDNAVSTLDGKAHIRKLNATTYIEDTNWSYAFDPLIEGCTGAGYGLDLYTDGNGNVFLIALFAQFGSGYAPNKSVLVKIPIANPDAATVVNTIADNATGLVVNGNIAFVTAFGGAQAEFGNDNSTLQLFNIFDHVPTSITSFTAASVNSVTNTFGGDFMDVAFANEKAYVLLAHYGEDYESYDCLIVQTTLAALLAGSLGTAPKLYTETNIRPASPTIGFLPGKGNDLYFTNGISLKKINTSVDIDPNGSNITLVANATDFAVDATHNGIVFNTAAVVVKQTATSYVVKTTRNLLHPATKAAIIAQAAEEEKK